MKKIILIVFASFIFISTHAQDYATGIGIRGGFSQGLTIKHFLTSHAAVEGIVATRWQGFIITGLYELHNYNTFDVNRLNWYYGIGGHIGTWNGSRARWAHENRYYTLVGIDAIIGIEYNFTEAPINISLDWKPLLNIGNYTGFWGDAGGLSIRYIF